ncbi:hypothetical protein [uncultured Draconibacterium sp.]|uniref:hypothetical protein n=1 Tax=uncultured Draconibacterium sp. TaxID=1573823 RepID=UPI002AA8FA6F|nr:hypothetical protein [uncultured Draconibacterium sp.]
MRKVNFIIAIVTFLVMASSVANATGIRTEFKEFEFTLVDDLYMGKKVDAIWTLSYDNSEKPVTVVKRNTIEGTEYLVSSEFFAVRYVSSASGFGVKPVRKSWSNVNSRINHAVINQDQLKNQEIISPNKVDDKMALGLIASYLPDLLNDGYTHLLN